MGVAPQSTQVLVSAALAALILITLSLTPGVAAAAGQAEFVQGSAFTTPGRVSSNVVTLGSPVGAGDLLVGWFAQYNAAGQVNVSDTVNGAWTRAAGSTVFQSGTGDIALYYMANSKPAGAGLQITVAAGAAAYFQGVVADYSGVAVAGPLDQVVSNRGVGTVVDTGSTTSVPAAEIVFSALVTGGNPVSAAAGSGFAARSTTGTGSAFDEDILSSATGTQHGSATLGASTDWYAVAATFRVGTSGDTQPPTTPAGLHSTTVTSTSVGLAWSASTDNVGVTGYTVYRNGTQIGTTSPTMLSYTDATAAPTTAYTYTVDAIDAAGNHSPPSTGLPVTTAVQNASPTWVQGAAATASTRTASAVLTLGNAVKAGDLLVGWFAEYNTPGQLRVSDNVNGAWTRAPASTAFQSDTGDIALYYLPNSHSAPSGLQITTSVASGTAYFQEAVGDYSGVAVAGPLDQIVSNRAVGTAVDTGPTTPVPAGELVFSGLITGGNPTSATPGLSRGIAYTARAETGSASAFSEDVLGSGAGAQDGTATLGSSTDWYAVVATFRPVSTGDSQPPTTPAGLHTTSVAATSVSLAWSASTDNVAVTGYSVYRNGVQVGITGTGVLAYTDVTTASATAYTYTVDAFDAAGNHSAQSAALPVTTPGTSPAFVQGAADSPGTRATSTTITFSSPVAQGHLLLGWFAQFDAAGQVQVSDSVNGAWTRSTSEHFTNGGGDLALYFVQNSKAAPAGLTITVSAASATYLPSAAAEFSGVATTGALDQTSVGEGVGTTADSGPTAATPAGELVVGLLITGGQPLTVTPGSSLGAPFALVVHNGSESADVSSILSGNAGAQDAPFLLATSMDWYAAAATVRAGS